MTAVAEPAHRSAHTAGEHDAIVVGAGPAGIAAALALKDRGVRPLVIERAATVAASWRERRYDALRLNTSRPLSHLPGRRFPRGTPWFPTRDAVVAHLERHAGEDGIDLLLGTAVERIDRDGEWVVRTAAGDRRAPEVVVATGYENTPFLPDWPGRGRFGGELIHACAYRNPDAFRGRRVLVVGAGCSGMEIAHDLATGGAAQVWLSVRTPPNVLVRQGPGPVPGDMIALALLRLPPRLGDAVAGIGRRLDFGDLTPYGLPVPEEGVFSRLRRLGVTPAIVDPEVVESIKEGRIEVVAGVEDVDADGVRLADGTRLTADAVVCATGYRRGLEPIVGHLGVLDERGRPRATGARPPAPGLRFIGYVPRPAALGYAGKEARRAARAIARELRQGVPA